MTLFLGAKHDLEKLIKTHLFVICPNKSGSTFLKNVLATSKRTWNLDREGQHTFGFAGPSTAGLKTSNRWASEKQWVDKLSDPASFDWSAIRRAWYFLAFSRDPNASVFVEKSPPFILNVDQLARNFLDARFLFMVRNPYAVIEGIRRHSPKTWLDSLPSSEVVKRVSTHVINCLNFQRDNVEKRGEQGIFLSYEQMCEDPERTEQLIGELVPAMDDVTLRQRVRVREYDENLRNMNQQQIERLSPTDIREINGVFSQHQATMDFFDYSLR